MRFHHLLPKVNGIPVLMYHHILPGKASRDIIDPLQLRSQWNYLKDNNYHCLSLNKLLAITAGKEAPPQKSFLLTFDDGYKNNLDYAYPLLKEFGWSATFFLIGINLLNDETSSNDYHAKLNATDLTGIEPEVVQFAMHGYRHENFAHLSTQDAAIAIEQMNNAFESSRLPYYKVLAYPYGGRPGWWWKKKRLEATLRASGIELAFRIGNKPQRMPAANPYQLKRIDINGTDSMEDFIIKLQRGKLHPF